MSFDDALRRWRRRFLVRVGVGLAVGVAAVALASDRTTPLVGVAFAVAAFAAWMALRLTLRPASVFIAAPRSAALPALQKENRGATDAVEDGLLVHSGRWTRPPVHVRSTGDGVLLTTTTAHARRLRRLL